MVQLLIGWMMVHLKHRFTPLVAPCFLSSTKCEDANKNYELLMALIRVYCWPFRKKKTCLAIVRSSKKRAHAHTMSRSHVKKVCCANPCACSAACVCLAFTCSCDLGRMCSGISMHLHYTLVQFRAPSIEKQSPSPAVLVRYNGACCIS